MTSNTKAGSDHSSDFGTLISRAGLALASNRIAEALEWLDRALRVEPGNVDALNAKGVALDALGRFEEATASFRRAIAEQPMNPELHFNAALTLQRQERFAEALGAYNTALNLSPNYPAALANRGLTLDVLGRNQEAVASIDRALRLEPSNAGFLYNLGRVHANGLNLEAARAAFEAALRIDPNQVDARSKLGHCLLHLLGPEQAITHFELALSANPSHGDAIEGLAAAYRTLERNDDLLAACRTLVERAPLASATWVELGAVLTSLGQIEEANNCFEQAVALDPKNANIYRRIGHARIEIGDVVRARESFETGCALQPSSAFLWRSLTSLTKVAPNDAIIPTLERLLTECRPSDVRGKSLFHFALGKALSDTGDKERSFSHFLEANRFHRRLVRYKETSNLGSLARTAQLFSPAIVQRCSGGGNPSPLPIFILGMARTGSTLVEQMLGTHSKVLALGELPAFLQAVSTLNEKKGVKFPSWLESLEANEVSALGDAYLSRVMKIADTRRFSKQNSTRLTDKSPGNFRFLGLIHMALPNARIIHTRRDAVATCLSCFENLFDEPSMPFSYDLGELGRYYRHYEELMAKWTAVLPAESFLTVDYEILVEDFENTARRIIAYCGLEWEDACLAFHRSDRPVRTVSASQVRQPLYTTSAKRWQPSDEILRPLLEGLGRLSERKVEVGTSP